MKPSDFMIGLINFLSILLPGAIVTILLLHISRELQAINGELPQQEVFLWVIAFAAAYFLGHLIFLAGSWFDPVYDFIRKIRDPYGGKRSTGDSFLHSLAVVAFKRRDWRLRPLTIKQANAPFVVVDRLRRNAHTKMEYEATNSFQWCRAILIQKSPAAHKDIEVHEADQKFFRSLVALSLAICVGAAVQQDWFLAVLALIAAIASFVRYYNRRLKTVTLAYSHVITMHRCGDLSFRQLEDETPRK